MDLYDDDDSLAFIKCTYPLADQVAFLLPSLS